MPRATSKTPNSDVIVDNARTDLISYLPDSPFSWFFYDPNHPATLDITDYFNNTVVESANGTSLVLNFTGIRVAVYGVIIRADTASPASYVATRSIYSINGTQVGDYKTPFSSSYQFGIEFFQSDPLPHGEHTLRVEVDRGNYFALDWIEYNTTTLPEASPSPSTSPRPTAPSTESASPSPTIEPKSSGKPVNIGAAVGGAIGGVVLLVGIVVAYCVWRRRRSSSPVLHNLGHDIREQEQGRIDIRPPPLASVPPPDSLPPPYESASSSAIPTVASRNIEKGIVVLSPSHPS